MANTEKIQALIAKIRESLQITPYATMETVNDLLEIVDLKLADAGQGGGGYRRASDDHARADVVAGKNKRLSCFQLSL